MRNQVSVLTMPSPEKQRISQIKFTLTVQKTAVPLLRVGSALLTIIGCVVKLHWSFASYRSNADVEQRNSSTGAASDSRFAAAGAAVQKELHPEVLSSGLPAVNGTFISFSTRYFIEQSQLVLCCISFPAFPALVKSPVVYY